MTEELPEGSTAPLLPPGIVETLPVMVRDQLSAMPTQRQGAFLEEYRRRRKRIPVAYLAWLLFGSHYAYLGGRWLVQFGFWLTGGGGLVWWVFDAFRLPWMVRNHNQNVAIDVLRDMRAISGS